MGGPGGWVEILGVSICLWARVWRGLRGPMGVWQGLWRGLGLVERDRGVRPPIGAGKRRLAFANTPHGWEYCTTGGAGRPVCWRRARRAGLGGVRAGLSAQPCMAKALAI